MDKLILEKVIFIMFESRLVHLQKQRIPLCWTSKATGDEATSGIINVFRLMTYPKKGETRCEPWQTFILHCKKWWEKLQQVTFRIAFKIDILLNVMKIESMQCHTNTVYIVWRKITVKAEFWCLWYLDEVSFKLLILLRISNQNRGTDSCLKKKTMPMLGSYISRLQSSTRMQWKMTIANRQPLQKFIKRNTNLKQSSTGHKKW